MPGSISSVRLVGTGDRTADSINTANTLGELVDLIPAPFRPRTEQVVNKAYRAAIKANHVRTYLSTLEKHKLDGTYPSEIGGRILIPAIQISKEYEATADCKKLSAGLASKAEAHRKESLTSVISWKKAELAYLQSSFAETSYKADMEAVLKEVTRDISSDAGVAPKQDGSISEKDLPSWVIADHKVFKSNHLLYPARAVALAFTVVSRETAKRFKALTLKRDADGDLEMQDAKERSETVQSLIEKSMDRFRKEFKIANLAKGQSRARASETDKTLPDNQIRAKVCESSPTQKKIQGQQEFSELEGYQVPRKRKREWEEEVSRQMKLLDRCSLTSAGGCLCRSRAGGNGSQVEPRATPKPECIANHSCAGLAPSAPFTRVSKKGRQLVSTDASCQFVEKHSDLFSNVLGTVRNRFVAQHTPVYLLEHRHLFMEGVFKGPGVDIPRDIEYKLALNAKFILHHEPNLLRVHQAWPHLERSVRLRWHFRNSEKVKSKFYVPKKTWQPPADGWHPIIERGLEKGKDLLFSQTADLHLSMLRRSNPDLSMIKEFLQKEKFLVKLTDKNLGLAVVEKTWYVEQCENMLRDELVYTKLDHEDVQWFQEKVLERIKCLIAEGIAVGPSGEYLASSEDDKDIPTFHAIPKVHKKDWTLRPIIPSHSWVTRKSSEIVDFLLRQIIKECVPWLVESTRDVIRRLQDVTITRSDDVWLITGDVESFYTNVPILETVKGISQLRGPERVEGVRTDMVRHLLEIIMCANCFQFNGKFYRQTTGVAMGTSCAPAFANLSLALREKEILEVSTIEDGLIFYCRYIDDIFLVFKGTKAACETWLDGFTPSLKPYHVSWEIHSCRETTTFLDVEFFFEQGFGALGIQSRVFRKRMNQHQYIPWSSAHPETVKRAFVKAEMTRFMIISSTKKLYEEKLREFMTALGRRGYPSDKLQNWKRLVKYEDRLISLSKRKESSIGLPLMLPSSYDEVWEYIDMRKVFEVMRTCWNTMEEPLPESLHGPLIKSLRRTENLFDKFSAWNKAILREATP